jgi:hypothetical protein
MFGPRGHPQSKSVLDDLSLEVIVRMKEEGFEPAVVVETSPSNFQAWLNHGQVIDALTSTRAAKQLAERFGGDPSSADCRHSGALPDLRAPSELRRPLAMNASAGPDVTNSSCSASPAEAC